MLDSVDGKSLAVATSLAYPLLDLVLLGLTVGALASTGWRLDRTWMLLAAGVSTFWLADSLYLVRTAQGVYEAGGWFDAGWWAGLALIAAAAWQPAPVRDVAAVRGARARDRRAAGVRRASASACSSTARSPTSTCSPSASPPPRWSRSWPAPR